MNKKEKIMNQKTMNLIKKFYKKLPRFKDGRIDYSKSSKAPVLTCVIKYKSRILLLKRSNKVGTYKGKWQVVAGYLDELKPLKEKVLEELKEELKVSEKLIKKITYGKRFSFKDKKINKTWIVHPVLAELKQRPKINLSEEHTEYKWIFPEEIKKYDTVPNLKKSLKAVLSMQALS